MASLMPTSEWSAKRWPVGQRATASSAADWASSAQRRRVWAEPRLTAPNAQKRSAEVRRKQRRRRLSKEVGEDERMGYCQGREGGRDVDTGKDRERHGRGQRRGPVGGAQMLSRSPSTAAFAVGHTALVRARPQAARSEPLPLRRRRCCAAHRVPSRLATSAAARPAVLLLLLLLPSTLPHQGQPRSTAHRAEQLTGPHSSLPLLVLIRPQCVAHPCPASLHSPYLVQP